MGADSNIAWTDASWNPWWGCAKVSPGCAHCYAETFSKRVGQDIWGKDHAFRFFGDKHWAEPEKWDREAATSGVRRKVFCASMADVFEDHPELAGPRSRLIELIDRTPNLDWLVLTKRAKEMRGYFDCDHGGSPVFECRYCAPRPNLWLGVSIENDRFVSRADYLRQIPAVVRFISAEPLLGPLVQRCRECLGTGNCGSFGACDGRGWNGLNLAGIDWLIVGGESGPNHRPMDPQWVRDLIDAARHAGTKVFFKQVGGLRPGGPIPPEFDIREYPR